MKEKKNPMSCFRDDDIGDDFLSAWKPSKLNSVSNLDFECSQVNGAPEKTFNLPENFDLDMDFGTSLGLNSKLSSFDIDLDFLKSPKHGDSAKENCGGALMSHSQTSSDAPQASSGHGRLQGDVVSKNRHAEENSTMESHDQVDTKVASKAGDSGKTLTGGNQKEMTKTAVDFSDKRVLKFDQETSHDEIKAISLDSSISKAFEGAAAMQGWDKATESLNTARETAELLREDVTEGLSTCSEREQQEQMLLPAQAVWKENNAVSGELLNVKNTEDASSKRTGTKSERRSFQETLQGVQEQEMSLELQSFAKELDPKHGETKTERRRVAGTLHGGIKEQSLEFQTIAEGATHKHVETKSDSRTSRGTMQGVTKDLSSFEIQTAAEEATPIQVETKTERRSFRGTLQGVTMEQSFELQSVGLVGNVTKQTDLQPHRQRDLERLSGTVTKNQDDKEQIGQTDTDPLKDIAADQVNKTNSAAAQSQELKTPSMLTKILKKVDKLDSNSPPLGAKSKSAPPKHSLSKAFMSLKPTQVGALRTSRSHALPLLMFEKQIAAPASKADDGELQSNLKAQVIVETRSSLQTSGPSLTRTTLGKKRGPPTIEESAHHTKASADVPERSDNEVPEKRPKLEATHRITEKESNQFMLLNAGQGKMINLRISAVEKHNILRQVPQAANYGQSRPPSHHSRLISPTRSLQQKDLGSTPAARIQLLRSEDIFVGTNSTCVQSSISHGQAVDPVTVEIIKRTTLGMNHKPESNHHGPKKPNNLVPQAQSKSSLPPLKDNRGGSADFEMRKEAEYNKENIEVSCPQLLLEDVVMDQACAKNITRDSKNICKTTAYYSVELDKIMSMLKQKQRRANDLLAEAMAHNAKMKYLLDSKNQEKISILQKLISERLEGVKLQAAENRAKRCQWCEEHQENEAAVLIKEHCNNVH